MDDNHNLAVFEWEKKDKSKRGSGNEPALISHGKGTAAKILSLTFNSSEDMIAATALKEVKFFTFDKAVPKAKTGTGWGKKVNHQAVLCGAYIGETFISGLFNGDILKWNGTRIGKNIQAHTKSCTSLFV